MLQFLLNCIDWNHFKWYHFLSNIFILSIQFCIGKPYGKGKCRGNAKYNYKLGGQKYGYYDHGNPCRSCKGKLVTVLNLEWFVLL